MSQADMDPWRYANADDEERGSRPDKEKTVKMLFEERVEVGLYKMGRIIGTPGYFQTESQPVYVKTEARWDKAVNVLCVDQSATVAGYEPGWGPPARRVLETSCNKATTQRRAIALADEWAALVAAAIPPARTEAEARAVASASAADVPF